MASVDISPDSEQNAATTVAESLPANETGGKVLPDRLEPALPPQQKAPYCVVKRSDKERRTSSAVPQRSFPSEVLHNESNGSSSGGQRRTVRLSATKGYSQVKGVDYGETYSPVACYYCDYCTVHYLRLGLEIHQLDVVMEQLKVSGEPCKQVPCETRNSKRY